MQSTAQQGLPHRFRSRWPDWGRGAAGARPGRCWPPAAGHGSHRRSIGPVLAWGSPPPAMAEEEGLTDRQKRLSLACTLAQEYLALGLPPPEATRKLASERRSQAGEVVAAGSRRRIRLPRRPGARVPAPALAAQPQACQPGPAPPGRADSGAPGRGRAHRRLQAGRAWVGRRALRCAGRRPAASGGAAAGDRRPGAARRACGLPPGPAAGRLRAPAAQGGVRAEAGPGRQGPGRHQLGSRPDCLRVAAAPGQAARTAGRGGGRLHAAVLGPTAADGRAVGVLRTPPGRGPVGGCC